MDTSPKFQENHTPPAVSSPNSHSSNSSSSSSNTNGHHHPTPQPPPPPPFQTITRSEPANPYPTTFVQADPSSFKQVVQMLTGAPGSARPEPSKSPIPPIKTGLKKENSSSRLYERRNSLKNFKISPLAPELVGGKPGLAFSGRVYSPGSARFRTPEILSPSVLDFPSLMLSPMNSPVTPLIPDPFNRSRHHAGVIATNKLDLEAEEREIAKRGFFLHPSPANTPREAEPRLLPLFPLTSPRVSSGSPKSD